MHNSIVKYFEETVLRHADRIAIETEKVQVTFKEYGEMAKKIGTYIVRELGIFKQPVAVYLPKDETALETYMGILSSGNFYCPIPYDSPNERACHMMSALSNAYLITSSEEYSKTFEWGIPEERILLYEDIIDVALDDILLKSVSERVTDCDPAYLLFTSGTTNKPKGVVVPHRAVIDRIVWMAKQFSVDVDNILASQAPFHFDASMPDIYLNIISGAKLVIPPSKLFTFPFELLQHLKAKRVNTLIWVPSALVNLTYKDAVKNCILEELRLVIFCGEVMHNKHLNILRKYYKDVIFVNMYGPTEATYACTYYVVEKEFADSDVLPIGVACGNTDVFLIDSENKRVEEAECEGEICISGSSLALGYYKNNTNTAFVTNIVQNEFYERAYRTGDIGKWNEKKELMFIGRKDNQIKHLGYRIELGEIEAAVQSIELVDIACVLYDETEDKIVLYYESSSEECDRRYIVKALKARIPKYMYPTVFFKLDEMPHNINGKIDRKKLKQKLGELGNER